jgi:glycosyltransferase involved in cell wall biosynthesis
MTPQDTHMVLIPAFNPGRLLMGTVQDARAHWTHVWVVVDASTDGSHCGLAAIAGLNPGLRIIVRPENGGKGAAVLTGALAALDAGFTHALVMDADGQHPADRIGDFMERSMATPGALVGFRVYPLRALVRVLQATRGGRRYDFDPEVAVRLAWSGTPAINLDAACTYVGRERGGVSHFNYLRDNLRMIAMHARLICALVLGRRSAPSA